MEVEQKGNSLYVKASEGKILEMNGIALGNCIYVALNTDTSKISEIDEQEEAEAEDTLADENAALLQYVNDKTDGNYTELGDAVVDLVTTNK